MVFKNINISGFSDEISADFNTQLETVSKLGMHYLSLRGIEGKNIGDYTIEEIQTNVKPRLERFRIGVSSIGSPIGKIFVQDEEAFIQQKEMLGRLCRISNLLDCKYIRIFSFYIPRGDDPDQYRDEVIDKIKIFTKIAEPFGVTLLHENEKDIYGDIARRCSEILNAVNSSHFQAIFDFANFVQCGEDPQECYDLLKNQVAYIHIKDAVKSDHQNVVCGTGDGKIASILSQAIRSGYQGFLTLEPHLVIFDSLKDLELENADEIIKNNKARNGAEGYKLQYEALLQILKQIESEENNK